MSDIPDGIPELFEEQPVEEATSIRETLLKLAAGKRIKYTVKYIKKASEKTLESIYEDFKRQELDETNDQIVEILIGKFAELMVMLNAVDSDSDMEKELVENRLLKSDLKSVVGYMTPYIPLVGILSGGLTVGKHVLVRRSEDVQKEDIK